MRKKLIPTTARAQARAALITILAAIFLLAPLVLSAQKSDAPAGKEADLSEKNEVKKDEEQAAEQTDEAAQEKKKQRKAGTFTIGEIIVKGESIAHIDQAATTSEVTAEDLQAHGNRTLDETLATVPGVEVVSHQKGIMRVRIRGFDQDKIAILVDGMPLADVYSTDIDISDISVKNISRIYVNRGVSSALYGASGAVGSINIVTKKPEKLFAQGEGEYGIYNNYTFNAAVGGSYKSFYGWVTASVQNSDGFRPSRALDQEERFTWMNRLVRYYVYGASLASMNVPGPLQYLTDTGKWNDTNTRKYNASGKIGYELTDRVEVGVSARFMYGTGNTNTYQNRCLGDYHIETLSWNEPIFNFVIPNQLKKGALVNRSFVWPEKYNFTVSPYLKAQYKMFTLKAQGFYYRNFIKQNGYLDNAHFYSKDASAVQSASAPYLDPFYDYHTYESYGVQVYPSFKFASWNRLSLAGMWRTDTLNAQQSAISSLKSPDIAEFYGTMPFNVGYLKASFITAAIEDEISIKKRLMITLGVSYDAQDYTVHKARDATYTYLYAGRVYR